MNVENGNLVKLPELLLVNVGKTLLPKLDFWDPRCFEPQLGENSDLVLILLPLHEVKIGLYIKNLHRVFQIKVLTNGSCNLQILKSLCQCPPFLAMSYGPCFEPQLR